MNHGEWNDVSDAAADNGEKELEEARLRERIRIEPMVLEEEFIRTPGDIAYLTARHADAIGEHLRAKSRAKKKRGFLLLRTFEIARSEGRKPTLDEVKAAVDQMDEMSAAEEEEILAEVAREKAKGAVMAISAKKDMLVQMGANSRAEMERDPVIRDRARAGRGGDRW